MSFEFRFLRVDMASKTCTFEPVPQEYAGLGGRALTSTIVAREVDPTCTALGPHNKLVFAPGLLGATNSPNSNRISVGCKSPLTGGIKESNAGGQPGGHIAKLGIFSDAFHGNTAVRSAGRKCTVRFEFYGVR